MATNLQTVSPSLLLLLCAASVSPLAARASPPTLQPNILVLLLLQVEALQETLGRMDEAGDVALRLTEEKAALELALREAKAAAEATQAAGEERREYAGQLEATCAELRRQLDATLAQQDVAHAAVEGAADQLQALTDSHEALERQLEAASAELAAAQRGAAQRGALAQHLEQRLAQLEGEARQVAAQRDAAMAQLQGMERQLGAAQQEAAGQRQAAADAAEQLSAVAAEARGLHAQVQSLQAANANLKENVKVRPVCQLTAKSCTRWQEMHLSSLSLNRKKYVLPLLRLHMPALPCPHPTPPHLTPPMAGAQSRVRGGAAGGPHSGQGQPDPGGQHVRDVG